MRNPSLRATALAAAFLASAAISFAAHGADYPQDSYKPAAYPEAMATPWEGWYLGLLLGYGSSDTDLLAASGKFNFDADGVLGGGQLGYNWQSSRYVFGLEGDLVISDLTGTQTFGVNQVKASGDWMAALRGRAGVLVTPQLLLFASLGYSWAGFDLPVTGTGGGDGDTTFGGMQVGFGAEVELRGNWGLRLDYLFTDLDKETVTYSGGPVSYDPDVHQVRGTLRYRF